MQLRFLLVLLLASFAFVQSEEDASDGTCDADGNGEGCKDAAKGKVDTYKDPSQCEDWAKKCECQGNKNFMSQNCAKSCALYGSTCKDTDDNCVAIVKAERVGSQCPRETWVKCPRSCFKLKRHAEKKGKAKKTHRCKRIETPGGLQNRSVDAMFGRIADEGWASQHKPKVLSRAPWVIYFDEFLTSEQIDKMWEAMTEIGAKFTPSSEIGMGAGQQRRTSESLHCPSTKCFTDPRLLAIHSVITNITGLQLNNHELPQLLKYSKGQFYVQHQDTSDDYGRAAHGNRIYTLFAYFSDIPEDAGGETHLPHAARGGIKVKPKKGAAVLWSNVLAKDPREVDTRSNHESLPVLDVPSDVPYVKHAANFWLYGYDWRTLWQNGCMNIDAGF